MAKKEFNPRPVSRPSRRRVVSTNSPQTVGTSASIEKDINLVDFIKTLPTPELVDGSETILPVSQVMQRGKEGAYIRGKRAASTITNFTFPENTLNYYVGNILLVDNNETFFSKSPTKINFNANQRKSLTYTTDLLIEDTSFLKNIVPTESGFRDVVNKLKIKCNSSKKQPLNAAPKYYYFEHKDAINIGGTIKNINFGIDFSKSKSITIVEYKQTLFSISLDNTYSSVNDYLQNITGNELKQKCTKSDNKVYSPAIIETVHYGKTAYLCAINEEESGLKFNIGEFIKGNADGGNKSWKLYASFNGGNPSSLESGYLTINENGLEKLIKAIEKPIEDAQYAVPISFEAHYLNENNTPVKLNILENYQRYIDKVLFYVNDCNSGASMDFTIRWWEPHLNANNEIEYQFKKLRDKDTDEPISMSPWAVAIEVKMDIVATDSYDFVFFLPYLPLTKLRVNEDGVCRIDCSIGGTTIGSAKNVTISPLPKGCYLATKNQQVVHDDKNFVNCKTEQDFLNDYFNWCERQRAMRNPTLFIEGVENKEKRRVD